MKLYNKNKNILKNNHSYDSTMEHDACGVGLIASLNGDKSRKVVDTGILNRVRIIKINGAISCKKVKVCGAWSKPGVCKR